MCGIGGFLAQRAAAPQQLAMMQDALRSRGPDAQHVATRGYNTLVHARLSIIDPRPVADQPMTNESGDVSIVYNGEVYDWETGAADLRSAGVVFRTRSDTEFILRAYEAWGIEKLLSRLRGMFAFGILDMRRGKAFLVRDRMGEKPLLYAQVDDDLVFGSTVRAVLPFLPPDRRGLSADAIDAYLAHRYVPAPMTVFTAITRLENGHYVEFDLRTRELIKRRYWQPVAEEGPWLAALDESVRMRTIADRPLGLLLSSGVDSTVIASRLARQALTQYRTFTAGFPGSDLDESAIARETAAALALRNETITMPGDIEDADFANVVAALDEPFADPSSFPTWYLAREVSRHVKVVLVGDGGDELFAGYKRIGKHMRTSWRRGVRFPFSPRPAIQGGRLASELAMSWHDAYSLRFSGFSPPQRAALQGLPSLRASTYWRPPDNDATTPLEQLLAIDLANYLPEYILRKSDLCTMAHGLEARAPMLDHRFVQRLLAVPANERFTRPPKALLREAVDAGLRKELFHRSKRGFNPPLRGWLRGKLSPRLEGLGARLNARTGGQLSAAPVDAFAEAYRDGAEQNAEKVLQLLMLDESLAQLGALARV